MEPEPDPEVKAPVFAVEEDGKKQHPHLKQIKFVVTAAELKELATFSLDLSLQHEDYEIKHVKALQKSLPKPLVTKEAREAGVVSLSGATEGLDAEKPLYEVTLHAKKMSMKSSEALISGSFLNMNGVTLDGEEQNFDDQAFELSVESDKGGKGDKKGKKHDKGHPKHPKAS